jgi:quercetin dioxygenase-like cupin family protein
MSTEPILLTAEADLATVTTSQLFNGKRFGVDASFLLNHTAPGRRVRGHRHPFPEVFVVLDGEVTFTVEGEPLAARGGQPVVVPADATHALENAGPATLQMISIHPVAEMTTEWAEPT